MRRPFPTAAILLWCAGLTACAGPAAGRAGATLDTTRFQPLPVIARVALLRLGAPEDPRSLLPGAFEDALLARGIEIDPNSPIGLSYRTDVAEVPLGGRRGGVGVFGSTGSSGSTDLGVGIGFPLFSSGGQRTGYRHLLEAVLSDATGRPIWRGQARRVSNLRDGGREVLPLVPLLLDRLGQTVRNEVVPVSG